MSMYKKVKQDVDFPLLEKNIMQKWNMHDTFKKSIKGSKDYIFYDGPPFANGMPHYGHLLTGYIKDLFARYHTMKGEKVERRFGWDCHGLPAEMGSEKELNISGRKAIIDYSIEKFNDHCRKSVLKFTHIWEEYIHRQGRWVDFENDYKTMDSSYMESVLWAFKQLYDKGLVYKSQRVMPYSWACETPVSDFETRMDNSYRQKESKSVIVKVKFVSDTLVDGDKSEGLGSEDLGSGNLGSGNVHFENLHFLIWTTTPWTLPSNLACAVGADIEYVVIKSKSSTDGKIQHLIVAKELAANFTDLIGEEVVHQLKGSALEGLKYNPIFDYFADHKNAFKILNGDFVTTEDGTGIVHIAPGFGEDDQALCAKHNIELVCPVDSAGKFESSVTDYEGMQVFEANDLIIKALKQKGLWLKTQQYLHNYPHCWRTDTPLIYKAVPSWYLKVTAFKDKMIKNNQQINWIPSHVKDGIFGKWLENARDWSISRNRFWGCPVPVWESDDPTYPCIKVFGSIVELEEAFGVKVDDLHMPYIDKLTMPNPNDPTGKSILRRVPEVLDCWFESGSMPYAQLHYPFENSEKFEENFPADFIVEYVAQTRGWFYTMLVLSTVLFDKPPFLNCICHGVILGDGGQKLSKRLKNYADPKEVFATHGADALRWYLMSSPVMRGSEIEIDKEGTLINNALRLAIKPLWNAYNFFVLYANADKLRAKLIDSSKNILDQYILTKLQETVLLIERNLDDYNTPDACVAVQQFFEILNNWYIRRSRERFWKSEKDEDKTLAYNTLYTVLITICKAICPLMPYITEEIYQNLMRSGSNEASSGDGQSDSEKFNSIHLEKFPQFSTPYTSKIIEQMERVRDACNAALSIRNDASIRVRQPLHDVTFIGVSSDFISNDLQALVLDEINVKRWINLDMSQIDEYADRNVKINFPAVGKRIPHKMRNIIAATKKGEWEIVGENLHIAGEILSSHEFSIILQPKEEFELSARPISSNDGLVLLNLDINEELKNEGYARDLVRIVQQLRKDEGFDITDKITIRFCAKSSNIQNAIKAWGKYIKEQTLAVDIGEAPIVSTTKGNNFNECSIEDETISISIEKASSKVQNLSTMLS